MVACVVCLCSVQCCMCRLCLASTSHDTSLRLWDLRMLQDGAEEEEEIPEQVQQLQSTQRNIPLYLPVAPPCASLLVCNLSRFRFSTCRCIHLSALHCLK